MDWIQNTSYQTSSSSSLGKLFTFVAAYNKYEKSTSTTISLFGLFTVAHIKEYWQLLSNDLLNNASVLAYQPADYIYLFGIIPIPNQWIPSAINPIRNIPFTESVYGYATNFVNDDIVSTFYLDNYTFNSDGTKNYLFQNQQFTTISIESSIMYKIYKIMYGLFSSLFRFITYLLAPFRRLNEWIIWNIVRRIPNCNFFYGNDSLQLDTPLLSLLFRAFIWVPVCDFINYMIKIGLYFVVPSFNVNTKINPLSQNTLLDFLLNSSMPFNIIRPATDSEKNIFSNATDLSQYNDIYVINTFDYFPTVKDYFNSDDIVSHYAPCLIIGRSTTGLDKNVLTIVGIYNFLISDFTANILTKKWLFYQTIFVNILMHNMYHTIHYMRSHHVNTKTYTYLHKFYHDSKSSSVLDKYFLDFTRSCYNSYVDLFGAGHLFFKADGPYGNIFHTNVSFDLDKLVSSPQDIIYSTYDYIKIMETDNLIPYNTMVIRLYDIIYDSINIPDADTTGTLFISEIKNLFVFSKDMQTMKDLMTRFILNIIEHSVAHSFITTVSLLNHAVTFSKQNVIVSELNDYDFDISPVIAPFSNFTEYNKNMFDQRYEIFDNSGFKTKYIDLLRSFNSLKFIQAWDPSNISASADT